MTRIVTRLSTVLLTLALLAPTASAIVESDTGKEYPDAIDQTCGEATAKLVATGVGVREKTFLKVDVYTIVSYVQDGMDLGDDAAATLVKLQAPKRLQMDLRRGFSREKLINAFTEVIGKNYDDQSAFAADMETFKGYFTRDAQDGDVIIFDYCPEAGLTTVLNGEAKGAIANDAFVAALWTVWFGEKPASKGLRKDLLMVLGE